MVARVTSRLSNVANKAGYPNTRPLDNLVPDGSFWRLEISLGTLHESLNLTLHYKGTETTLSQVSSTVTAKGLSK